MGPTAREVSFCEIRQAVRRSRTLASPTQDSCRLGLTRFLPQPASCWRATMPSWQKIARRIRVPLGFAFAALYIWLAHPTWRSVVTGSGVAVVGLVIRALASGHVRK